MPPIEEGHRESESTDEGVIKRAALYARVSTKDKGQTPETQLLPLRDFARARGYAEVLEYVDVGISGSKSSRPQLDRLMGAVRRGGVSAVLVARFDRFARSTSHLLRALEEFRQLNVDFISLNESVDTSTPLGRLVFTILGAVAEMERELIRERVQAGLARAKREGKQLGRPRIRIDAATAYQMVQEGLSLREIGRRLGCSRTAIQRLVKASHKPVAP